MKYVLISFSFCFLALSCNTSEKADNLEKAETSQIYQSNRYDDLTDLFRNWRNFETPPLKEGAPDYTKVTFEKRWPKFKCLQQQLKAIDTTNWRVQEKVDWMIVWAEMNGYDFNYRILKPWERDPAFYKVIWTYKSDVPAHEGPTNHGTTELWTYSFPLSSAERTRLILNDLQVIPPFYKQAKQNLTGNAKDLWITGIRDIKEQALYLEDLKLQSELKNDLEMSVQLLIMP